MQYSEPMSIQREPELTQRIIELLSIPIEEISKDKDDLIRYIHELSQLQEILLNSTEMRRREEGEQGKVKIMILKEEREEEEREEGETGEMDVIEKPLYVEPDICADEPKCSGKFSFSNKLLYKISDYLFKAYFSLGIDVDVDVDVDVVKTTVEPMPAEWYSDAIDLTITNNLMVILFIFVHGGIEVIDGKYDTLDAIINTNTIKYGIRGVSTMAKLSERYLVYAKICNALNTPIDYNDPDYLNNIIPLINSTFFQVFPIQGKCFTPQQKTEYQKLYKKWTRNKLWLETKKETRDRNEESARMTATRMTSDKDIDEIITVKDTGNLLPYAKKAEAKVKALEAALAKAASTKTSKASTKTSKASATKASKPEKFSLQKQLKDAENQLKDAQTIYSQKIAKKVRKKVYQPDDILNNRHFSLDYKLIYIPKKNPNPYVPAPIISSTLDGKKFDINNKDITYNTAGSINKLNQYLFDECIRFRDLGLTSPVIADIDIRLTDSGDEIYYDYCPRDIIMLCDVQFTIPRCVNNVTGAEFFPRNVVIKKNESFITNPHVLEFFIKMFGVKLLLRPIYIQSSDVIPKVSVPSIIFMPSEYKSIKTLPDYSRYHDEAFVNYRYKVFPVEITNSMIYNLLHRSGITTCNMFDNSCEDLMCYGVEPDTEALEILKRKITEGGGVKINTLKRDGRNKKTMKRDGRNKKTRKRDGRNKRTRK